jgi:AcrR family transcriptional regulator
MTPDARPLRADAAQNRARLLAAAREVFAERGARTSLNEVVRRAGVGPGTLYRHFPTLRALMVALIHEDVAALCAHGRQLLAEAPPEEALRRWLEAFIRHASTMQGLPAAHLLATADPEDTSDFAALHDALTAVGADLLDRWRQDQGPAAPNPDIRDVLRLANAIAWACQQAPEDQQLPDRLLALIVRSEP